MDEKTHDDRHSVHPKLTTHFCQILHLHNLPSNQKQDSYWSIPASLETLFYYNGHFIGLVAFINYRECFL